MFNNWTNFVTSRWMMIGVICIWSFAGFMMIGWEFIGDWSIRKKARRPLLSALIFEQVCLNTSPASLLLVTRIQCTDSVHVPTEKAFFSVKFLYSCALWFSDSQSKPKINFLNTIENSFVRMFSITCQQQVMPLLFHLDNKPSFALIVDAYH